MTYKKLFQKLAAPLFQRFFWIENCVCCSYLRMANHVWTLAEETKAETERDWRTEPQIMSGIVKDPATPARLTQFAKSQSNYQLGILSLHLLQTVYQKERSRKNVVCTLNAGMLR